MSVYVKLMQARIKLQGMELKKSGENRFAGYKYFELGDFLPQTQQIFHDLNLCSVVSFKPDFATLDIIDTEDGTMISITSPMAEAQLKGAHPIQNLGAVESYQRRYLWMAAMEIVEHDVIDATASSDPPPKPQPKPEPKAQKPKPLNLPSEKLGGVMDDWQVRVHLEIKDDRDAWLDAVMKTFRNGLAVTMNVDNVNALWRVNRQILGVLQEQSPDDYQALIKDFTKRKEHFTGAQ